MLSHALGATKSTSSGGTSSKTLPILQVASYVNEEVHAFSSTVIAKCDETPSQSCMLAVRWPSSLWILYMSRTQDTDPVEQHKRAH